MVQHEQHWAQRLIEGLDCRFPVRNDGQVSSNGFEKVEINLGSQYADQHYAQLAATWALTLSLYTGSETAGFVMLNGSRVATHEQVEVVPFEVHLESHLSISKITEAFHNHQQQKAFLTRSFDWAKVSGIEVAQNTLVLVDLAHSEEVIEDLLVTVRLGP